MKGDTVSGMKRVTYSAGSSGGPRSPRGENAPTVMMGQSVGPETESRAVGSPSEVQNSTTDPEPRCSYSGTNQLPILNLNCFDLKPNTRIAPLRFDDRRELWMSRRNVSGTNRLTWATSGDWVPEQLQRDGWVVPW